MRPLRNYILRVAITLTLMLIGCSAVWAKDFVIVLDPGHGGYDVGAQGATINEKDVNLAVARKLGKMIKKEVQQVKVVYTRDDDRYLSLMDRCLLANKKDGDLFISIHSDSSESNKQAVGSTVFSTLHKKSTDSALNTYIVEASDSTSTRGAYLDSNDPEVRYAINESLRFGRILEPELVNSAGRISRGVRQRDLLVLQFTKMPSVLVELDFICNPEQEAFLASDEGQEKLAAAICSAVKQYVKRARSSSVKPSTPPKKESKDNKKDSKGSKNSKEAKDQKAGKNADKNKGASSTPEQPKFKPGETVYKVQLLTSGKKLAANDPRLKGLAADFYQDSNLYKYTYGATTSMPEATKILKEVRNLFPDAFIITTRDGNRVK